MHPCSSNILLYMAILVFGYTVPAQAGIMVSVGNLDLQPGGSGFVNVMIKSSGSLTTDLNAYNFEFRIDTLGATRLEFVSPQSDPQLIDPDYVFSGDSADAIFAAPVGAVSTAVVPNDTFIGGDGTFSGNDVAIGTSQLLARLEVKTATLLPPVAGDQFTISLIPSGNTFFVDSFYNSVSFTSTPGTVTIAQSVPEPSSLLLWLSLGALGLIAAGFRHNRGEMPLFFARPGIFFRRLDRLGAFGVK